ncbi:MAG: serine/threonine-protein kinase, partial [Planctomycetota bacterium]|nr:serine/threonine-protein kinase [Planctomycetota bacterium]
MTQPQPALPERAADWEAFYRDYRKPGYVSGFEITSKLGGGQFGLVFRAKKQSIGKDYAIKFLHVEDTEVRRAVLNELEQVKHFAQIDHPNLVSIEDRGEVDGIPFLVMAFAGTETLKNHIRTDGVPPPPAERDALVRWFLQACRGTAALHERSLVHFDIKPANVFLKGAVARIGDYGLSKLVTHSRGSLSMGRGTPYYMAPEMLQRRGDARSDIYSLGIVLYEILCGAVPFKGDSEWEVLRKHEKEAPLLPAHLSAGERAVLLRCLQKDPAARYQSVHDLISSLGAPASAAAAAWTDIRSGAGVAPAPAPPPPLPAKELPPYPDPYAGFRKASHEAYTHASKIAREAMANARDVAQKAAKGAREMMREAQQRVREQHAKTRRARQEQRRAAVPPPLPGSKQRSGWAKAFTVVGVLLLVWLGLAFLLFAPRSLQVGATVASEATDVATEISLTGPAMLYRSVAIPNEYAAAVSMHEPEWVVIAQSDLTAAGHMLEVHIARLQALAPLEPTMRAHVVHLPSFRLVPDDK